MRKEVKESAWAFAISLCGIVGGTIIVFGLIESMLQTSVKAIIGKKD